MDDSTTPADALLRPPGGLSAVTQQVQSDRAVLVGLGAEVGWSVVESPESDPAGSAANDWEGPPPHGEAIGRRLPERRASFEDRDEAVRNAVEAIPDASKVRHRNQTEPNGRYARRTYE